ncbi:hypothetical protein [Mycolicibacterium sp. GF69]|uniref:hypothetical protein n=1 Tax=Mycolicibacterium sp. GF69 TaxID=2267251 RepID=UPI001F0CA86C|nr:hypothetical protein [Mycolicibacterium sp. GF69]
MAKRMIFTLLLMNSVGHNFFGGWRHPRARNRDYKTFDRLLEFQAAGSDGVQILNMLMPESYDEFFDHVVPVLQDKGLMQTEYRTGTLREKIFGADDPHISGRHPAFGYRGMFSAEQAGARMCVSQSER